MTILLTGGTGYIGSHTAVELINSGYQVIIADNLCNSKREVLKRLFDITGTEIPFYETDTADIGKLNEIFEKNKIDGVIHFAGLKAVPESVEKPLLYYRNNLGTTLSLLEVMAKHNVNSIIFSSSATVCGTTETMPITEDAAVGCTNPYGWTKMMSEQIIKDAAAANPKLSGMLLRYFNPIGAHESGRIGEDPNGIPGNLIPYITQVAIGRRERLNVYGNDYSTTDGTGVRDYIHVVDLAKGHVAALEYAARNRGAEIFNLGCGKGYSVLEIVDAFKKTTGQEIPYVIGPRRAGDIAVCYSDPGKANRLLGWNAQKSLEDMCRDSWRWQKMNPSGYGI